jgi:microcin C transport system substrate-binding protein
MRKRLILLHLLALVLVLASCTGGDETGTQSSGPASNSNASFNKDDYPVFPDADAGADPSVPAEQGGKGFTGEGWETNTSFDLIGDPRAVKGGVIQDALADFPGTLRVEGPESNSFFNYGVTSMVYERLLDIDTKTLDFIPSLATHWQISPDKMTYRYRINPNARFSDGTPVTAEDVVASYDFVMDKTLQAPSTQMTYAKFERPVAESKYIVSVKSKVLNWRNFLYFSADLKVMPAAVLKTVNGEKYLKDYNFKLLPGSGPYIIREEDVKKGNSISARRRTDYWNAKARMNVGMYNFDELKFTVVRDEKLVFEMFKKGELDFYVVGRAKEWVEETNFENVQRGLVQKRKIFNSQPWGFSGFAFNSRRAPFDDIRVRKAMTLLINRPLMIEKLAFNEYIPNNSYHPASVYENPSNPKNLYDPQAAVNLLAEAGWKDRDSNGKLVKNGQPLTIELLYPTKTFEPYLTRYQEDLQKVGVTLNLRLVTPETAFKLEHGDRQFQMAYTGWGGLLFPNPETSFHSMLADQKNNNNITGFKNARVDELCKQYDVTFDPQERIRIIREIDGLVANDYTYALLWTGPFTRVLYWNKFGTPPGYWSRTGDYGGAGNGPGLMQMWWADSAKAEELEAARRDTSKKMEVGPLEDRYWIEFDAKQRSAAPAEGKKQ